MNILRTRWIVYLNLDEGYIYCNKAGWVSIKVISQSAAEIRSFTSKDEAQQYFPDEEYIQFIEVNEHIYTQSGWTEVK